jgi:hypothetical protein
MDIKIDCEDGICEVVWKPNKDKGIEHLLPYMFAYGLDLHNLTLKELAVECEIPEATLYRCIKGDSQFSLKNAMSIFIRLYSHMDSSACEFFNELLDHHTRCQNDRQTV